jgi:hypothetical protein
LSRAAGALSRPKDKLKMATLTSPFASSPGSNESGRTVLVYTAGAGVQIGTVIDRTSLDNLALWLCEVDEYCSHFPYTGSAAEDDRIDREKKENGGYCDRCQEHAGKLLARFFVIPREDSK